MLRHRMGVEHAADSSIAHVCPETSHSARRIKRHRTPHRAECRTFVSRFMPKVLHDYRPFREEL